MRDTRRAVLGTIIVQEYSVGDDGKSSGIFLSPLDQGIRIARVRLFYLIRLAEISACCSREAFDAQHEIIASQGQRVFTIYLLKIQYKQVVPGAGDTELRGARSPRARARGVRPLVGLRKAAASGSPTLRVRPRTGRRAPGARMCAGRGFPLVASNRRAAAACRRNGLFERLCGSCRRRSPRPFAWYSHSIVRRGDVVPHHLEQDARAVRGRPINRQPSPS